MLSPAGAKRSSASLTEVDLLFPLPPRGGGLGWGASWPLSKSNGQEGFLGFLDDFRQKGGLLATFPYPMGKGRRTRKSEGKGSRIPDAFGTIGQTLLSPEGNQR